MRIDYLTLFPEMFDGVLNSSILKRAQDKDMLSVRTINFRDYAENKHNQVDDYPFGGGQAIEKTPDTRVVLMCPQGKPFDQQLAQSLSESEHIVFICGHYEGYDERIREQLVTDEISIGDYVLTGGELPAMTMTDAIVRLLPGVLGNQQSHEDDSFQDGLLEFPQYTRPREYGDLKVPDVLLSGNHAKIEAWRHEQKLIRTYEKRPDLLERYPLSEKDQQILKTYKKQLKSKD